MRLDTWQATISDHYLQQSIATHTRDRNEAFLCSHCLRYQHSIGVCTVFSHSSIYLLFIRGCCSNEIFPRSEALNLLVLLHMWCIASDGVRSLGRSVLRYFLFVFCLLCWEDTILKQASYIRQEVGFQAGRGENEAVGWLFVCSIQSLMYVCTYLCVYVYM